MKLGSDTFPIPASFRIFYENVIINYFSSSLQTTASGFEINEIINKILSKIRFSVPKSRNGLPHFLFK